ncbi:MAG: DUF2240 family protein [Candidatus Thermoplasmatota archaeon]|jgi:hypothetical protein|nr:DUF2240 family protein [Candidatus Thermoplasmatota archaeon]
MASENEIILAFLFKRSGKDKMSFSELYLNLSIDLKWFSPEEAKKFLNNAIKDNLLIKENDQISPSFDVNNIKIPIGFTPSKKVFTEKKNKETTMELNVLKKIVNRICEKTNLKESQVFDKINNISKEKNIIEEIAALLVLKEHNIELDDFLKEIENSIF